VIQTCRQCGAAHGAESANCYVCHARLSPDGGSGRVRSLDVVRTKGSLALAPDWRTEVALRLQEYRQRQRRLREGPSQPELAFADDTREAFAGPAVQAPAPPPPAPRAGLAHRRPQRVERIEIDLLQPSLDFSGSASPAGADRGAAGWHSALVLPMASLHERRLAALVDAGVLLFAYGSFLALFSVLGGQLAPSKVDAAVLVATLAVFYGQYFTLFTLFGGTTPGMMLRGLRLATFDGGDPHIRQLAWRSFGYLVSAGTMMLGFLWALWDEEHLCWHDRISHTHLTWAADELSEQDRAERDARASPAEG